MTVGRLAFLAFALALTMSAFSTVAYSQVDQGAAGGRASNYHFAEQNELTIVVSVLGAVARPGRYEVSRTIDLLNLLALAGGTLDNADLGDVRLYRTQELSGRVDRREIRLNLKDLSAFQGEPFELQQGDFLFVGRSSSVTIQEVLSYVSTAALLTITVITIIRVTGPGGGTLR
jgi:hypothetical protein